MTFSTSFAVVIPAYSFNGRVGEVAGVDGGLAELEVGLGVVPAPGPAGGLRVRLLGVAFAGPRRPWALLRFRMSS